MFSPCCVHDWTPTSWQYTLLHCLVKRSSSFLLSSCPSRALSFSLSIFSSFLNCIDYDVNVLKNCLYNDIQEMYVAESSVVVTYQGQRSADQREDVLRQRMMWKRRPNCPKSYTTSFLFQRRIRTIEITRVINIHYLENENRTQQRSIQTRASRQTRSWHRSYVSVRMIWDYVSHQKCSSSLIKIDTIFLYSDFWKIQLVAFRARKNVFLNMCTYTE